MADQEAAACLRQLQQGGQEAAGHEQAADVPDQGSADTKAEAEGAPEHGSADDLLPGPRSFKALRMQRISGTQPERSLSGQLKQARKRGAQQPEKPPMFVMVVANVPKGTHLPQGLAPPCGRFRLTVAEEGSCSLAALQGDVLSCPALQAYNQLCIKYAAGRGQQQLPVQDDVHLRSLAASMSKGKELILYVDLQEAILQHQQPTPHAPPSKLQAKKDQQRASAPSRLAGAGSLATASAGAPVSGRLGGQRAGTAAATGKQLALHMDPLDEESDVLYDPLAYVLLRDLSEEQQLMRAAYCCLHAAGKASMQA